MTAEEKREAVKLIKLIKGMTEVQQSGLNVMLTGLAVMKGKEKSGVKTANYSRS